MKAREIAALMGAYSYSPDVQLTQTAFRQVIAEAWGIQPGWRVLEVGCGQGDMTAVLADCVGPEGHVTGIDPAPGSYGAPVNLADSIKVLTDGPLGERLDVHLGYDLLRDDDLPLGGFDAVVFAHCTWYFSSAEQLTETLRTASKYAERLRVSEWDLTPTRLEQVPHLLAVLIRGQVEATNPLSEANVRTPVTIGELVEATQTAGWVVESVDALDTTGMQDADWEIGQVFRDLGDGVAPDGTRSAFSDLVAAEVSVLRGLVETHGRVALPSAAISARLDR